MHILYPFLSWWLIKNDCTHSRCNLFGPPVFYQPWLLCTRRAPHQARDADLKVATQWQFHICCFRKASEEDGRIPLRHFVSCQTAEGDVWNPLQPQPFWTAKLPEVSKILNSKSHGLLRFQGILTHDLESILEEIKGVDRKTGWPQN